MASSTAGGKLIVQLYNANDHAGLANTPVTISVDGVKRQVGPGDMIVLAPGESTTLRPRVYHKFGSEEHVLMGEVSLVNDDQKDNASTKPSAASRSLRRMKNHCSCWSRTTPSTTRAPDRAI